jgi:hypothetical protein
VQHAHFFGSCSARPGGTETNRIDLLRSNAVDFVFYGRVSTEDNQDPEASRNWQRTRALGLIEPVGGVIVAEFFDIGLSRSLPWKRRPQAAALLEALTNPGRGLTPL